MGNKKDEGVLYIRYDRNTFGGQVIEKLKKDSKLGLNENKHGLSRKIIELILLSEIVELSQIEGIDLETFNRICYKSLKFFSEKLNQTKYRIDYPQTVFQGNHQLDVSLIPLKSNKTNDLGEIDPSFETENSKISK